MSSTDPTTTPQIPFRAVCPNDPAHVAIVDAVGARKLSITGNFAAYTWYCNDCGAHVVRGTTPNIVAMLVELGVTAEQRWDYNFPPLWAGECSATIRAFDPELLLDQCLFAATAPPVDQRLVELESAVAAEHDAAVAMLAVTWDLIRQMWPDAAAPGGQLYRWGTCAQVDPWAFAGRLVASVQGLGGIDAPAANLAWHLAHRAYDHSSVTDPPRWHVQLTDAARFALNAWRDTGDPDSAVTAIGSAFEVATESADQ